MSTELKDRTRIESIPSHTGRLSRRLLNHNRLKLPGGIEETVGGLLSNEVAARIALNAARIATGLLYVSSGTDQNTAREGLDRFDAGIQDTMSDIFSEGGNRRRGRRMARAILENAAEAYRIVTEEL